jgi:hypothetical protein
MTKALDFFASAHHFRIYAGDKDWCPCIIALDGWRNIRFLGSNTFKYITEHLLSAISTPWADLDGPESEIEEFGVRTKWVLTLSEGYSTLHIAADGPSRLLLWQDKDAKWICTMRLSPEELSEWRNKLLESRTTGEEEEIRAIERARLRALVEADMETASRLHADDFQLVTPGGRTLSKEEYLDGIASGNLNYAVFEAVSEITVRLHGQAAHIRYRSRIEITFDGQTDGGFFWHTDTYEKIDGQWQIVWSQATRIR